MVAVVGATKTATAAESVRPADEPFGYCLNTSTIREKKLGIVAELEIASRVGYHAVEPWMRQLAEYVQAGGVTERSRQAHLRSWLTIRMLSALRDGLSTMMRCVPKAWKKLNAIWPSWRKSAASVWPRRRSVLKRSRAWICSSSPSDIVNCWSLATNGSCRKVEVWGHSQTLGRLGEAVFVAVESGHPKACLLPDVYHIFKGGSDFAGLKLLSGAAIHVFHVNDYPAEPARAEQTDAHRVYPGDGVAPLSQIFRDLHASGFSGYLSLELFNRDYWQQDPEVVAKTGLEKQPAPPSVRRSPKLPIPKNCRQDAIAR